MTQLNPNTFRLRSEDVQKLHDALCGDNKVEEAILYYINKIHGAKNLFYLRPGYADWVLRNVEQFKKMAMFVWLRDTEGSQFV